MWSKFATGTTLKLQRKTPLCVLSLVAQFRLMIGALSAALFIILPFYRCTSLRAIPSTASTMAASAALQASGANDIPTIEVETTYAKSSRCASWFYHLDPLTKSILQQNRGCWQPQATTTSTNLYQLVPLTLDRFPY